MDCGTQNRQLNGIQAKLHSTWESNQLMMRTSQSNDAESNRWNGHWWITLSVFTQFSFAAGNAMLKYFYKFQKQFYDDIHSHSNREKNKWCEVATGVSSVLLSAYTDCSLREYCFCFSSERKTISIPPFAVTSGRKAQLTPTSLAHWSIFRQSNKNESWFSSSSSSLLVAFIVDSTSLIYQLIAG